MESTPHAAGIRHIPAARAAIRRIDARGNATVTRGSDTIVSDGGRQPASARRGAQIDSGPAPLNRAARSAIAAVAFALCVLCAGTARAETDLRRGTRDTVASTGTRDLPALRDVALQREEREAALLSAGLRIPTSAGEPAGIATGQLGAVLLGLAVAFVAYWRQRSTRLQLHRLQNAVAQRTAALNEQRLQTESALRDLQQHRAEVARRDATAVPRDADLPDARHDTYRIASAAPGDDAAAMLRILVVDDDAVLRDRLRELFATHFDVSDAADGEAALRCARRVRPDLVVSDLLMPRLDGLELLRALRADACLRDVPLILLSERADSADEIRALDAGADRFLLKPLDPGVLLAHVRTALRTVPPRRRAAIAAPPSATSSTASPPVATSPAATNAAAAGESAASPDPFVARVTAWLDVHLHEETVDMESLAAAVHVSRATLYRRYAAASGESPAAALQRLRLDRARVLLDAGEGTVSEIAHAVGFRSLSAFSHAWRKRHGGAPTRRTRTRAGDEAERSDG